MKNPSQKRLPWWLRMANGIDRRMERLVLFRPTGLAARRWKIFVAVLMALACASRLILGGTLLVDLFLAPILVSCVVFRNRGFASVPLAALLYFVTGILCHDLPNAYVGANTLGQLLEWVILALFVLITLDRYAAVKRLENRISRDLEMARRLQSSLIQPEYEFGRVRIRGFVRQTHDVGGDFYYFRPFQEKYVVFCLGDVMGKGIAASLLMAIVMGFMFEWGKKSSSPAFILKKLNSRLRKLWAGGEDNPFITVFYTVYDEEAQRLTYAGAGHQGALLIRADGTSVNLVTEGIPVGVFDEAEYEESACDLKPGERVLLFTDGVTEARSPEGELFGIERLQDVLLHYRGRSLDDILEAVEEHVARHTGGKTGDDVAVLAMEALTP